MSRLVLVLVPICAVLGATAGPARADDDPMAFAEIRTGRPSGIKCPDARPCVIDYDGAFFVFARGWKRYYILDHADPKSALRTGAKDDFTVSARAEAAVRAILKFHKAKVAAVECGVAGSVPALVGSKTGDLEVAVPAAKAAATPTALTPDEADAAWMKAREPVDAVGSGAGADRVTTLFAGVDTTAMTAATFKRPHLRWRRAWTSHQTCQGDSCTEDEMVEASVLVIYSPESKQVYLVDRSSKQPTKDWERGAKKAETAAQDAVFSTLTALGVKRVVVDADSICAVPRVAGKNGWFTTAK